MVYDPTWVYLTTDVDVATAFAARYVDPASGLTGGGWVYEVETAERPVADPDFPATPEAYVRVRRATIRAIVKRGVRLSRTEQLQLERRFGTEGLPRVIRAIAQRGQRAHPVAWAWLAHA